MLQTTLLVLLLLSEELTLLIWKFGVPFSGNGSGSVCVSASVAAF